MNKLDYRTIEMLRRENERLKESLRMCRKVNRSYRKALRFYADKTIYDAQYKLEIMRDCGDKARKELKELKN